MTHAGHWQAMFWILLVHGVIMLLSTLLFTETLQEQHAISLTNIVRQYRAGFGSRALIIYALFVGFVTLFSYCFAAAAPGIAQTILHINTAQYGYANLSKMAGMLVGDLLAASLLKRIDGRWLLPLGAALILCFMLLLAYWYWQ